MLRKQGCVPSALTQNAKDLLASREIENILDNTDFMILLSQAQSDRAILAKQIGISEHQLSYICLLYTSRAGHDPDPSAVYPVLRVAADGYSHRMEMCIRDSWV